MHGDYNVKKENINNSVLFHLKVTCEQWLLFNIVKSSVEGAGKNQVWVML
jgi:hypothetical protein